MTGQIGCAVCGFNPGQAWCGVRACEANFQGSPEYRQQYQVQLAARGCQKYRGVCGHCGQPIANLNSGNPFAAHGTQVSRAHDLSAKS